MLSDQTSDLYFGLGNDAVERVVMTYPDGREHSIHPTDENPVVDLP